MSKARGLADLGNVYNDGALSNRNVLINSSFSVAQRGTSFASSAFVADRWYVNSAASGTTHSRQEFALGQTDVEGSPTYFLRMGINGATSRQLYQKVEDIRQFENKTYTYSFWAKANATLTPTVRATADYDGSAVAVLDSQEISVGTSWAKYEITLTIGSFAGKTIGASSYLQFDFTFFDDSVYEFDLAQPQVEAGDTATPFEHRSYGDELARCQRYFHLGALKGLMGGYTVNNQIGGPWNFPVTMRAVPTVTFTTLGGQPNFTGVASPNGVTEGAMRVLGTYAGLGDNIIGYLDGTYEADAEL